MIGNDNHSHGCGIVAAIAAATDSSWSELALEALRKSGHRSGGARQAVVELLAETDCCLSAQEIADRLKARRSRVGIASVYRAIDVLQGIGLVQRVDVGEGTSRYESVVPGGEHHHHIVCDSCGRISAFEDPGLERAITRVAGRIGHRVHGHDVLLHGHCSRCEAA
jgi:Fur family ferric uptake transcriptional regulator